MVIILGIHYSMSDQSTLPVMVMEKMQQNLKDLIEKHSNIPLFIKLSILDNVCLGLRYLHTRAPPIIHRDLTPNNILLSCHLDAKITDLGIAKIVQSTGTQSTMTPKPGTAHFMPPESIVRKPVYHTSLDVFSYGGVVLYTAVQQWPEPDSWMQLDKDTGNKIYLSELQRRQCYFDQMTGNIADLKKLVKCCLEDDPKSRPSMAEVSEMIKEVRTANNKKRSDRISPAMWWAMVSGEQQQPQVLQQQHQQQPVSCYWQYIAS